MISRIERCEGMLSFITIGSVVPALAPSRWIVNPNFRSTP